MHQLAGANVVIPAGKKIMLDVSPPELTSITIESGGQLVWSPAGDYEVRAKYVLVKGKSVKPSRQQLIRDYRTFGYRQ